MDTAVFDEVHDCQETFRLLLSALSYPGELVDIRPVMDNVTEDYAAFFLFALTLMDKETTFAVIDDDNLSKILKHHTYAAAVDIDKADFLFVPKLCSDAVIRDIVGRVKAGTIVEPHTNCVLLIGIGSIPDEDSCKIAGPGVPGVIGAKIPAYALKWLSCRDEMGFEYPTGIDLYFISDDGALFAIPRKVKTEVN